MTTPGPNAIGAGLGLLGDEWNLLIVRAAMSGPCRYSRLQETLGIAPSILAARLATLTEAAVLEKVPEGARFAYRLTSAGRELWRLLLCIWAWEQRWVQGEALPTMRHLPCGDVFVPVLTCGACGSPVQSDDVRVELGPAGALARAVPTGRNRRRAGDGRADGPGLFPETMALMGNRWSSVLLGTCFLGLRRFSEFEAALGAPPTVVSDRLGTFVSLGVLDDGYALTAKGRDFFPVVAMLVAWGERWVPAADGLTLIAHHRACGDVFVPGLVCSCCDEPLHRTAVSVEVPSGRSTDRQVS